MANIEEKYFKEIDLNDHFFSSLKADYSEFSTWYLKKANNDDKAFVLYQNNQLMAFLYLKIESDTDATVIPPLSSKRRLKVGTFKIDAHGTKLGERFIKRIFDVAIDQKIEEIYVTLFEKHQGLLHLFTTFGFFPHGIKRSPNGDELVLVKRLFSTLQDDLLKDYPIVNTVNKNIFGLSIQPQFHTRLFSDSILKNERVDILHDVSHTNSIHKIYICAMKDVQRFKSGDIILIYRSSDGQGAARYRSVITSICVIEEVVTMDCFSSEHDYLNYCEPYSVFSEMELKQFYKERKYPFMIKMTYNSAFKKRVTNGQLVDDMGISPDYWGVFPINHEQFRQILTAGAVDESIIIH